MNFNNQRLKLLLFFRINLKMKVEYCDIDYFPNNTLKNKNFYYILPELPKSERITLSKQIDKSGGVKYNYIT